VSDVQTVRREFDLMASKILRVDLSDFSSGDADRREAFIERFGDGLCETGFVVVGGHNLPSSLTGESYKLFKRFFALKQPQKDKYICLKSGNRGYSPFGREKAKDAKVPDLKEFWHVCQAVGVDHRYRSIYLENFWPDEIPELKATALELYRVFENCARQLLQAFALYFELPENRFAKMIETGNSVHRIIHYPPLEGCAPKGAIRAAAHEDINLMTLLIESHGGGLEIQTRDKEWVPVESLEGDIIVDTGDMMKRITNGVVPATTHRVVNPSKHANQSRYSMPFFVHPYPDCDLTIIDDFISDKRPAQWPPTTAHEYLTSRLKEIGLVPHSGRLSRIDPSSLGLA
jgi:isopenicillin N synthase-like dioxygenase